jgi:hypothetical protein
VSSSVVGKVKKCKGWNSTFFKFYVDHRHKRIHRLSALFWKSSYVSGHCLAVAPQSGVKQIFYCTVYYITLNSN